MFGSGPLQDPSAGRHRCPGRDHVIDQQNPLACETPPPRQTDGKSAGDVATALVGRETDLASGIADPLQYERFKGHARRPGYIAAQHSGLIERAPHEPPAMQRHRHDHVRIGQQVCPRLDQPPREQMPRFMVVAIFEAVDQPAHDLAIGTDSPRPVIGRWIGQCRCRDDPATRIERHRQAKHIAQRRTNELELAPAPATKRMVPVKQSTTGEAHGRHHQITDQADTSAQHLHSAPEPPAKTPAARVLGRLILLVTLHAMPYMSKHHRNRRAYDATARGGNQLGNHPVGNGTIGSMTTQSNNGREIFDRDAVRRHRDRAARSGVQADFLLTHIAEDFADRLSLIKRTFPLALNLGAHHGQLSRRIAGLAGIETIIDMDDAPALIALCDPPRILADEEALPIAPGSLDVVVSALKLQFANDLPGVLVQARQALKPDGLFLAAILGPDTLRELRQSLLMAETEIEGGTSPHVAPFVEVRQAGALLQRAGFALPVADSEILTVTYASPFDLFRDLRAMGATNPLIARRRKPMRRETLAAAAGIYRDIYALPVGRIPATFEIVTLTGWAPHDSQQKPLQPGSAQVSLASVLRPGGKTADDKD